MAELRWILLLAGLVFLLALATWELRRAQRARRAAGAELDEQPQEGFARPQRAAGRLERRLEPTLDLNPPLDPQQAEPIAPAPAGAEPGAEEPGEGDEPAIPLMTSTSIAASAPLRVEWPDEGERRLIAVRIVAAAGERLPGRAVRQALGACGFVHGPFRIYHQPATDGRALLSCANLNKPGDFDPLTLDFQRLTGLSLFAMLPGPVPPLTAFDHLLATADELAQRLRAELADERGAPLDAARVAALRASVQHGSSAGDPNALERPAAGGRPGAESARGA